MRTKLIAVMTAATGMLMSTPLWAGGHGHGHWKPHFHGHHHHVHGHHAERHVVVRERRYFAPVYARPVASPVYAAPAPGVAIVLPSLFIPLW